VIALDRNVGFAAGNNLAVERARGRRILLLNPDTIVLEGTFRSLWDFAERTPLRGIWGGRTLFEDGSLNPTSCWRRITPWSLFCSATGLTAAFPRSALFNPEAFGGWPRDSEREVDIVSGCFLLVDHALWNRLGGFDPTFFMYGEEADLCLRAQALGARPAVTPQAELIHLGGRSEVSQTEKVIKVTRGRATLIRRHWSPAAAALGRAMLLGWSLLRLIGSRLLAGPNDAPGGARAKWAEIWRRRAEWVNGYPDRARQPE
jgi:GT2 family glycosyltransferase